ncbi:MAG: glycosyltransferase family 2 protein [Methylobacteriaceae bacterium]|nr:glycosyltransferase family 2 protein [Methylobacteriaceae bacterium]
MSGEHASRAAFLDEKGHADALTMLAARCLNEGDFARAFMFADRRCRIEPAADARHYLLRAEASRRLGDARYAEADLKKAVEIDPTDVLVNRSVLGAADRAEDHWRAAHAILAAAGADDESVRGAVEMLRRLGSRVIACVASTNRAVTGWVLWSGERPITAALNGAAGTQRLVLEPDPLHPLAHLLGSASQIFLALPDADCCTLSFFLDEEIVETRTISLPGLPGPSSAGQEPRGDRRAVRGGQPITIIIPVYNDYQATRDSIASAVRERQTVPSLCIIAVDDASPDPRIRALLEAEASAGRIELVTNAQNLGFARSVNRALLAARGGDILLLNADTILPAGAVSRLAAIAHVAPEIGSVTPISNNGEFTSFPLPNRPNPMPSAAEARELDRIASRANTGVVTDIPNGIGFCLYIKRACFDAVGPLSTLYRHGYFEDVEFCLQARRSGFRNVCAPSVFVAHAGARSFGAAKRALVVRNLAILEARYPTYRAECADFMRADPLGPARNAIERLLELRGSFFILAGRQGLPQFGLLERARQLAAAGHQSLILSWRGGPDEIQIFLRSPDGDIPQSLEFAADSGADRAALARYLRRLSIDRVEVAHPATIPKEVLDVLIGIRERMDLLVMDGSALSFGWSPLPGPCADRTSKEACDLCLQRFPTRPDAKDRVFVDQQNRWWKVLNRVGRIIPLDAVSRAFAERALRKLSSAAIVEPQPLRGSPWTSPGGGGETLGIVTPGRAAVVDRLLLKLGRTFEQTGVATPIVVIGNAVDNLRLMSCDNIFVTGKVEEDEQERVIRQYRIGALFLPYRMDLFFLIERLAANASLPKAYFDWSFGAAERKPGDLALDPRICDDKVAIEVSAWSSFVLSRQTA